MCKLGSFFNGPGPAWFAVQGESKVLVFVQGTS